jgi:hypothetical protein
MARMPTTVSIVRACPPRSLTESCGIQAAPQAGQPKREEPWLFPILYSPYVATVLALVGVRTVYVRFEDNAGNVSATAYDRIKYSPYG